MPDKQLTVITYAASASLAAAALVYFFSPNYLIDGEPSSTTASMRRKGVVGLSNTANDCFINSVLQALAGLRALRVYLIRELHRRELDGAEIYENIPEKTKDGKPINARKQLSLQKGDVTQGLKDILDRLNERPLYRKTISASAFIDVLQRAFGIRISKSQQDAQELLQVVAERVSDEYRAGKDARKQAKESLRRGSAPALPSEREASSPVPGEEKTQRPTSLSEDAINATNVAEDGEDGFPLEGRTESRIVCMHCNFTPKSTPISFVMLTLPVPQKNTVSLDDCFDSYLKVEYIDDYKCDRCRLQHAIETYQKELQRARSEKERHTIERKIEKLKTAMETDPEKPPPDVKLPHSKLAPTRRIARSVRIVDFPQILVVHLSRSIFDSYSSSKNTAKVLFPERLPLGGLQQRRNYRLLGVVSHKGTHNSGHYETFRRQHMYAPTSNPHHRPESGPYSRTSTPGPSNVPSPRLSAGTWGVSAKRKSSLGLDRVSTLSSIPGDDDDKGTDSRPATSSSTSAAANKAAHALDPRNTESPTPSEAAPSTQASSSSHSLISSLVSTRLAPPYLTKTPAPAPSSSSSPARKQQHKHNPSSREPNNTSHPEQISSRKISIPRASHDSIPHLAHSPPSPPLRRASRRRLSSSETPTTNSSSYGLVPHSLSSSSAATAQRKRDASTSTSVPARARSLSLVAGSAGRLRGKGATRRPAEERWWRISDDKIKECKTGEVLGMQKEVYILFYEIERD